MKKPLQTDYDLAPKGFEGQSYDMSDKEPITLASRGVRIRTGAAVVYGDVEGTAMLPDSAGTAQAAATGLIFAGIVVRSHCCPCDPCAPEQAAPIGLPIHAFHGEKHPLSVSDKGRFYFCAREAAVAQGDRVYFRHAVTAPDQLFGELTNVDDAGTQLLDNAIYLKGAPLGEMAVIEFDGARSHQPAPVAVP